MNHPPHHEPNQQCGQPLQGKDGLDLGHGDSSVETVTNSALAQPLPGQAVPILAAGTQRGPAAFLSVPLSAFLDAGPCFDPGPCGFIDFDDEREFDFSRVKARPQLRLVISNSSPVKA